jgi:hypothetical protein
MDDGFWAYQPGIRPAVWFAAEMDMEHQRFSILENAVED